MLMWRPPRTIRSGLGRSLRASCKRHRRLSPPPTKRKPPTCSHLPATFSMTAAQTPPRSASRIFDRSTTVNNGQRTYSLPATCLPSGRTVASDRHGCGRYSRTHATRTNTTACWSYWSTGTTSPALSLLTYSQARPHLERPTLNRTSSSAPPLTLYCSTAAAPSQIMRSLVPCNIPPYVGALSLSYTTGRKAARRQRTRRTKGSWKD